MNNLLKPDEITSGILTSLLEDTWKLEDVGKVKNLSQNDLISINLAFKKYENAKRFERGDFIPFFDYIPESIYHPIIRDATGDGLSKEEYVKQFHTKGVLIYDNISRSHRGAFRNIFKGDGIRIIWFENGDIKVFSSVLQINSEGFSFFNIQIDNTNLYTNKEIDIYRYIDDGGRKIHFSKGLGDVYLYFYLLTNIKGNFEKVHILDYVLRPQEIDELSCFSKIVRAELWNSIANLIEDVINNDKDDKKLSLIEFLFEFMFIISVEPSISDLYRIMKAVNAKNINQDESTKVIMALLQKIDKKADGLDMLKSDVQEIKVGVKTIDSKLDVLINKFNGATMDIRSLLEKNADETSTLIRSKTDELVNIIDQLYRNNSEQEYLLMQNNIKQLYRNLNIEDEALLALASGYILAEQKCMNIIDQSGAILLLVKGLEILLNNIFKTFMINKLSRNSSFNSSINRMQHSSKDRDTVQWLLGRDTATLGQVAYFCSNFSSSRYVIGQEADNCLIISSARRNGDESIIRGVINYIKVELTNQDVHNLRNGFIHKDIAQIEHLNWVVTKTNSILIGLNQAIENNR